MTTPAELIEEHKRRVELMDGEGLEVPTDASPVDFLQAIYRDPRQPMPRRMKAAIECAPYMHPKLSAAAITIDGSFADRLDRAMMRSRGVVAGEGLKLIEGSAEHDAEELKR
jgi:hypothetical protein